MRTLAAILLTCLWASEKPAKQLPELSFRFFDSLKGTTIEATDGWILAQRDKSIDVNVLLEVESVEAPYELLIFRDSSIPDPLLRGSHRPQNLWLAVFRISADGRRTPVSILTHCSGSGGNLRVYSSTISFRILYPEPERSQRIETIINRLIASLEMSPTDDSEMLEKRRYMFRRQLYEDAVDMPSGDYVLEATYAPIVDGMWKGKLQATAKIRVGEQDDPLSKIIDQTQGK